MNGIVKSYNVSVQGNLLQIACATGNMKISRKYWKNRALSQPRSEARC